MMNSASRQILIVSLFVFLAGFVRAELTSPSHRFFGATHTNFDAAQPGECTKSDDAAITSLEVLHPLLQEVLNPSVESVATMGAPAAPVEILPTAPGVVTSDLGLQWLAGLADAPKVTLLCTPDNVTEEDSFVPAFSEGLPLLADSAQ